MDASDPRLRMLYDYTVFHIGLYTTLVTALFALMTFGHKHQRIETKVKFLKVTVLCFLLAGAAGGATGSNLPQFRTFDEYSSAGLSVFGLPALLNYSFLTHL